MVSPEGCGKFAVIDDEVARSFVVVDPSGLAGEGWAGDENDAGFGGAPFVVLCGGVALEVAVGAGGAEVGGVVPCAAVGDGGDVVDLCCGACAGGPVDLAGVCVSLEDGSADALPGAGVLGFGHGSPIATVGIVTRVCAFVVDTLGVS